MTTRLESFSMGEGRGWGVGGEGESVVVSNSVSGARTRQYTGREEGEVEGGSFLHNGTEDWSGRGDRVQFESLLGREKDEYADMQILPRNGENHYNGPI